MEALRAERGASAGDLRREGIIESLAVEDHPFEEGCDSNPLLYHLVHEGALWAQIKFKSERMGLLKKVVRLSEWARIDKNSQKVATS